MKTISQTNGTHTSEVEITQITSNGIWLFVKENEYFLSYKNFPWFKEAKVKEIMDVELFGKTNLHWESLDVDLSLDIINHPENYPLVSSI